MAQEQLNKAADDSLVLGRRRELDSADGGARAALLDSDFAWVVGADVAQELAPVLENEPGDPAHPLLARPLERAARLGQAHPLFERALQVETRSVHDLDFDHALACAADAISLSRPP